MKNKLIYFILLLPLLSFTQTQIGQDIDGEAEGDESGSSVSISADGNIVAIGAPFNYANGDLYDNFGQVRVYENISGVWIQIGDDINGDTGDLSGKSVSLSADGNIVAIGNIGNGRTRIYGNMSGIWTQIGQDINGETQFQDDSISISLNSDGSIIAIGSTENSSNAGKVRIYENISGSWVQIGQDIDGEVGGDFLGRSVSLSSEGNILAIGVFKNDANGIDSGKVSLYENVSDLWTQIGSDIIGEASGDESGYSVSLSSDGSIIAIGAPSNSGNGYLSGQIRIFKNQSGVWNQVGNDINGESQANGFGGSVSLSSDGSIIAIGAPGNDSGYVRVYSITSELALLEVIDDISGNANGENVTAEQLNSIEGVSGAIDGVNYTTALQNGTFVDSNNPTAIEIQLIIDQVNNALSINDNLLLDFILYPNPTKNQFTIRLNDSSILKEVNIYNNLGQQILTSDKMIIDTSSLASGSYVVEVATNNGKATKQLIIE